MLEEKLRDAQISLPFHPCFLHIRHSSLFAFPPHVLYISDTVYSLPFYPIFFTSQTQFTVCLSTPCSVNIRHSSLFATPPHVLYISDTALSLPLLPIFCTYGCHNNSRLLIVALLYFQQHNTPHFLFNFSAPNVLKLNKIKKKLKIGLVQNILSIQSL